MKEIYAYFDNATHYLGKLTKLSQIETITRFMATFKQLAIHK